MTFIIRNMLEKKNSSEKLNNLIYQATRVKEVNLDLHNLDRQAKINQKMYLTKADEVELNTIEQDNKHLELALIPILIHLTKNMRVTKSEFNEYVKRLKYLLEEDVDFASLSKVKDTQACRIYIVAKMLTSNQFIEEYLNCLDKRNEKTL